MGAVTIGRSVLRHLTLLRYGATGWGTISLAGVAVDEELPRPKGAPVHASMPNHMWRQPGDQDVQLGARHLTGAVETCPPSPTPRTANALFAESIPTVTMVLTTTSE